MPNVPLRPSLRYAIALTAFLVFAAPLLVGAEDGVIDLAALPNYAIRSEQITNTGATLGRLLFYDKRLSRNDTVNCSSCHQQAFAFGSPAIAGTGVNGMTSRHPMRLANARSALTQTKDDGVFFWDRRALTLESAVTQPIRNSTEMGFSGINGDPDFAALITKLSDAPEYQLLFNAAFGSPGIDEARIQKALGQFIRSIQSLDSKFDAGAVNRSTFDSFPNFTASENRGKRLFLGQPFSLPTGIGCNMCHADFASFANTSHGNNGVVIAIGGGTDTTVNKSPSLRDLFGPAGQLNGPMMHTGSFTSISQVLDHYSAIPPGIPNLDSSFANGKSGQTLNLTQQDRIDIEAFLLTLSSNAIYTDAKWSNPFRLDGTITVRDTTPPASQTINLSSRMQVGTAGKVAIGGFIVTGAAPKRVLVRALGPSLAQFGLTTLLADPTITLNGSAGFVPIVIDSWKSSQEDEIRATGLAPGNDLESAIVTTLLPGNYTATLSGTNGGTGIGILEIYDLDLAADSKLGNISTRAFGGRGDDMLIAGFTVGKESGRDNIIVRGLGRSLFPLFGTDAMTDPNLEVRNADGVTLVANDTWQQGARTDEIVMAGLRPADSMEAAVVITAAPGAYTALLSASSALPEMFGSHPGIALIEIYSLGRLP